MFVAKDIAPRVLFLVQEVSMPTLDDVYRKFGETAEAAQLLETELGTALMVVGALRGEPFDRGESRASGRAVG